MLERLWIRAQRVARFVVGSRIWPDEGAGSCGVILEAYLLAVALLESDEPLDPQIADAFAGTLDLDDGVGDDCDWDAYLEFGEAMFEGAKVLRERANVEVGRDKVNTLPECFAVPGRMHYYLRYIELVASGCKAVRRLAVTDKMTAAVVANNHGWGAHGRRSYQGGSTQAQTRAALLQAMCQRQVDREAADPGDTANAPIEIYVGKHVFTDDRHRRKIVDSDSFALRAGQAAAMQQRADD
jgi:hypothetical protein